MPAKDSSAEVTQGARSIAPETAWMREPSFNTAYDRTSRGSSVKNRRNLEAREFAAFHASLCGQDAANSSLGRFTKRVRALVDSTHRVCRFPPSEPLVQHGKPKASGLGRSKANDVGDTPHPRCWELGYLQQGPAHFVTLGKIMIMNYINGYWSEDCVAVDPRGPVPPNQKSMAQSRKERAA